MALMSATALPVSMAERVEVRWPMSWFNDKFFEESPIRWSPSGIYKRFTSEENGARRPRK